MRKKVVQCEITVTAERNGIKSLKKSVKITTITLQDHGTTATNQVPLGKQAENVRVACIADQTYTETVGTESCKRMWRREQFTETYTYTVRVRYACIYRMRTDRSSYAGTS